MKNSKKSTKNFSNQIEIFTLNNNTVSIEILNLGCIIKSIYTPCKNGFLKNIVAGFSNIEDYKLNEHYFGCILGRFANRISDGNFILSNKKISLSKNEGHNHLHGGFDGFNKKIWNLISYTKCDEYDSITLSYLSKNGEEGYPGNLIVSVNYLLNKDNQLIIKYMATSDSDTILNLSNHSYFNLSGFEESQIYNHYLYVNADKFLEKNLNNIPTGQILPVDNTFFDFKEFKKIGQDIRKINFDEGYDHDFVLNDKLQNKKNLAAILKDLNSGRKLSVYTEQPSIHLYSANYFHPYVKGFHGFYKKHSALAIETQSFPDSPNHSNFPTTLLKKDENYETTTIYEFGLS